MTQFSDFLFSNNSIANRTFASAPSAITKIIDFVTPAAFPTTGEFQVLYHFDNGSEANDFELYRNDAGHLFLEVHQASASTALIDLGVVENSTPYRVAATGNASGIAASLNGATALTDTLSAWPSGMTVERYGINALGTRPWGAEISHVGTLLAVSTNAQIEAYANFSGSSGGGSPPPSDIYTKLLCHFDGANNATTFTDSSPSPHTSTVLGTARLSTTSPKFGTASLLVDSTGGGVHFAPAGTEFQVATGDFTVDFWWTPSNVTAGYRCLATVGGTYSPWQIGQNGTALVFYASKTGTSWAVSAASIGSCAANTPVHIEICRSGNVFKLFNNGTQVGSDVAITGSLFNPTDGKIYLGCQGTSILYPAMGYMDEFRFRNGIAEHTSNFTPPTSAY